jgi:DEAD/DEAH box helicase domain-containing protein
MCGAPERDDRGHDVHHIRPFREFGGSGSASAASERANALDNLITLCRSCHGAAERALGLHGGLTGVGHAIANIAPLYLMCDPRDLGVFTESMAPWTGRPTVAIYERAAAGVGFGQALFELHETVLRACSEHVAACPCPNGCPSCIGPGDQGGPNPKRHALSVLAAIQDRSSNRTFLGNSGFVL